MWDSQYGVNSARVIWFLDTVASPAGCKFDSRAKSRVKASHVFDWLPTRSLSRSLSLSFSSLSLSLCSARLSPPLPLWFTLSFSPLCSSSDPLPHQNQDWHKAGPVSLWTQWGLVQSYVIFLERCVQNSSSYSGSPQNVVQGLIKLLRFTPKAKMYQKLNDSMYQQWKYTHIRLIIAITSGHWCLIFMVWSCRDQGRKLLSGDICRWLQSVKR